jgi:hypothetical protein
VHALVDKVKYTHCRFIKATLISARFMETRRRRYLLPTHLELFTTLAIFLFSYNEQLNPGNRVLGPHLGVICGTYWTSYLVYVLCADTAYR